jgi:O-antigen/teichoic acid export membrane protein
LLESASWSIAAAIVARGANLAAMILCARLLTQQSFGEVAIVQSTVGMFGPIAGLGLAATTTKFLAEYRDTDRVRAGRLLGLSLLLAAAAGAMMTVALVLLAPVLAQRGLAAPQLAGTLAVSGGLLLFGVFEAVQTGALAGLEAFSRVARLSCWNGLVSIPIIAMLAYTYGSTGAIVGLTLSSALACFMNWIALRAECREHLITPTLAGAASERRVLTNFSLPSYLSGLLVFPSTWIGSALLVNQVRGLEQMALYTAADRFRFLLIFLPLSASRIAIPALSRFRAQGDHAGFNGAFRWNLMFGVITAAVPAIVCMAFSPFLMSWFGAEFRTGWPVLALLALSAIPTVLNTQLGSALLSKNRAWARASADVLLATVFFVVAWFAVPQWGAQGLALAFALSYVCACLMMWMQLRGGDADQ